MAEDIKALDAAGLVAQLEASEVELLKLRFQHAQGQLQNSAKLGVVRKQIARLRTELRAREISDGLAKRALETQHRAGVAAYAASGSSPDGESGGLFSSAVDKA